MATSTSTMNNKSLSDYLRGQDVCNLFLFFGEEDYFIDISIKAIQKKYISDEAIPMDYVRINRLDIKNGLDSIIENIQTPPWLSARRVIVVNDCGLFTMNDPDKTYSNKICKLLESIPSSCVVIFVEKTIDKRKKAIMKAFQDNGVVAELSFLDDVSLCKWIFKRLSRDGVSIDEAASTGIVERCEKSMRRISNEVEKISLYCVGEKVSHVDEEIVELMCPPDISGTVFVITDAIGSKDSSTALVVLDKLLVLKEPCSKIRFMFARHLRQLICAKDCNSEREVISKLSCHPFVAGKLYKQAARFDMSRLLKLFDMCCNKDYLIKSGKADERESLESLICLACV